MAPGENGATEAAPVVAPEIRITFQGAGLGGVDVKITPTTTDAQLYAAAWVLDAMAHEIRAQIVAAQARAQLVTAGPGDLRALAAAAGVKLP